MGRQARVYRSLEEASASFAPSTLTIGNFDGVHIGHQDIFRRVIDAASRIGAKPSVLTFDPHPSKLVAPERAPKLLSTVEQRCDLIAATGIEQILVLPFTAAVASLSPEEFVNQILRRALGVRVLLIGGNFRFGRGASGDTRTLVEAGARSNFEVQVVEPVRCRGHIVSSTEIRTLIACGRVGWAARFLGRPYGLEGEIVSGHGVGKRQTVPTLNLSTTAEVLPARGVYVTRTTDLHDGRQWRSVTNVGVRPTFGGDRLTVETFLLAPLEGADPSRIRVDFWHRLREERKFENPEVLKAQILRDAARAIKWHSRAVRPTSRLY